MTAELLSFVGDVTNRKRMTVEKEIDPRAQRWYASSMELFIDGNIFGDYEERRDWETPLVKLDHALRELVFDVFLCDARSLI